MRENHSERINAMLTLYRYTCKKNPQNGFFLYKYLTNFIPCSQTANPHYKKQHSCFCPGPCGYTL